MTADNYLPEHMMTASTRDMYIEDTSERIMKASRNQEGGTATVMRPDIFKTSRTVDIKTDRIVLQRLKDDKIDLLVGSVYMPTDGDQKKYQEMCDTIIEKVTQHKDTHTEVILIGDMNIQEGHNQRRKTIFKSMADTLNLVIHTPETYTNLSRNKNKTRSILDYILATPGVDVGKIEVYHLDRLPENTSTHSPIFATVKVPERHSTKEEKEEIKDETMTSPFSNYLARKRPNWDNMDKELFHKLVKTKTKAIWPDIGKQKADLRLNSLITILVRSALDASASIPDKAFTHEEPNIRIMVKRIKTKSEQISRRPKTE